eukprot:XP_019923606.1 PREDICTED: uncharacterized protein LOC105330182 [Crassostrea gigas]
MVTQFNLSVIGFKNKRPMGHIDNLNNNRHYKISFTEFNRSPLCPYPTPGDHNLTKLESTLPDDTSHKQTDELTDGLIDDGRKCDQKSSLELSAQRFKTVTNEEIEKFFDSRQAKSTKRNTAWGFFKIGTWRSMVLY